MWHFDREKDVVDKDLSHLRMLYIHDMMNLVVHLNNVFVNVHKYNETHLIVSKCESVSHGWAGQGAPGLHRRSVCKVFRRMVANEAFYDATSEGQSILQLRWTSCHLIKQMDLMLHRDK